MVTHRIPWAIALAWLAAGCSLLQPPDAHTRGGLRDAGPDLADAVTIDARAADAPMTDAPMTDAPMTDAPMTDAPVTDAPVTDAPVTDVGASDAPVTDAGVPDASGPDAPLGPPPRVRVAHLARDTGAIDVYANDELVASSLGFAGLSATSRELASGAVVVRITRAGSAATLLERTFSAERGREYTLAVYGDEERPPFGDRTLELLWLDDDASGLDVTTEVRLAAVHVASPVIAGQLVAVRPEGNLLLADDFGFRAVAPLTLPSAAYVVGFDAGADGVVDLEFVVPALVPGTYANVFVAARPDDGVFLFVTTQRGAAVVIDPTPTAAPRVRVAHLARDTGPVDVYANGALVGSAVDFATVSMPRELAAGSVALRLTLPGTTDPILERTFTAARGREYTLAVHGDEDMPPFGDRTLELLWLDDDASGLDTTRDVRLAVIHVASPVVAGQLVAVRADGNLLLADDFGFRAVAPLTLPSMAYVVGFDAGADGVVDLEFDLPTLVPGTYANVFVAARPDDSVFLLVNTRRGATLVIDPR
jgi:hypothetical protein